MRECIQDVYEKPTVYQMLRLNKIGVVTALGQQKLKKSSQHTAAHIFLASEHEQIEEPDKNGMRYTTHRFIGRVAKVDFQRWSMRVVESYWIRGTDDQESDESSQPNMNNNQDGFRTSYLFEWSRDGVIQADKHMKVLHKSPEQIFLSRQNSFDNPDDVTHLTREVLLNEALRQQGKVHPEVSLVARELQRVSRADCDLLIEKMHEFSELSSTVVDV